MALLHARREPQERLFPRDRAGRGLLQQIRHYARAALLPQGRRGSLLLGASLSAIFAEDGRHPARPLLPRPRWSGGRCGCPSRQQKQ